ncbi:hypothetical protein ACMHYJ_13330 [Castellaniella hirudinis]|uniref:hypothetical protein n=1 Tax=Castellaniella hirudinis TaxID=1144617 RepID=UPI0039C0466A
MTFPAACRGAADRGARHGFGKKRTWRAGVGDEYWHNKFGKRDNGQDQKKPGTHTHAITRQMAYRF